MKSFAAQRARAKSSTIEKLVFKTITLVLNDDETDPRVFTPVNPDALIVKLAAQAQSHVPLDPPAPPRTLAEAIKACAGTVNPYVLAQKAATRLRSRWTPTRRSSSRSNRRATSAWKSRAS